MISPAIIKALLIAAVIAAAVFAWNGFISYEQSIGYNRAAGLLEEMEKAGVVSAMSADGRRMVLS